MFHRDFYGGKLLKGMQRVLKNMYNYLCTEMLFFGCKPQRFIFGLQQNRSLIVFITDCLQCLVFQVHI